MANPVKIAVTENGPLSDKGTITLGLPLYTTGRAPLSGAPSRP